MITRPLRSLIWQAEKLGMNIELVEHGYSVVKKKEETEETEEAESPEGEEVEMRKVLKLTIFYGEKVMAGGTFRIDEEFEVLNEKYFRAEELVCAGIASNLFRSLFAEWKKKQKT